MPIILDGTLGETFPSWTTAGRPASPSAGQMGYNTTIGQFDAYTSGGWVSLATTTSTSNKVTTSQLPAGTVLQVVSATATTEVSTSAVDTWVSSGLSASITPSSASSRIVIIASQNIGLDGVVGNADVQFNLGIFRNSTLVFGQIAFDDNRANQLIDFVYRAGISYLDSPATTSSVTYTTRGSLRSGGIGSVKMQYTGNPSSIILMEIAG